MLLYLFGSKDDLVQALLARARADELAMLSDVEIGGGLAEVGQRVWRWLTHPDHRRLLTLWAEGYTRSLVHPAGPWADFAQRTVNDWLDILAAAQPPRLRRTARGAPSEPSCLPCFVARSSTCLRPVTWLAPPPQCRRTSATSRPPRQYDATRMQQPPPRGARQTNGGRRGGRR